METQSCELADLLVLHSHRTSHNKLFWRGALIQTKLHSGPSLVPQDPQFWLYDQWPVFSVTAPDFFDDDPRSGRYALVSNNNWEILEPLNPLVGQSAGSLDFGTFLVSMLYDMDPAQPFRTSSHGRQVYHNSSKDWSRTIWDIVAVTANMKLKNMGKKKGLYHDALPTRRGFVYSNDPNAATKVILTVSNVQCQGQSITCAVDIENVGETVLFGGVDRSGTLYLVLRKGDPYSDMREANNRVRLDRNLGLGERLSIDADFAFPSLDLTGWILDAVAEHVAWLSKTGSEPVPIEMMYDTQDIKG
jgi:hypothetical protein